MTVNTDAGGRARLRNMDLAMQTLLDLVDAGEGSPRIGLFYGPSGYGKTFATAFCGATQDAAYIEANPLLTKKSLLDAIALELGIARPERTTQKLFDQIVQSLTTQPRPLVFDEADYLLKLTLIEIVRAIGDRTMVPVLLVGEEALPQRLREWERVHNRVLVATAALPSDLDDGLKLRDAYCRRVQIADDLVGLFVERTRGVTRRVVVNLQAAERAAMAEGALMIDRAWWGDRPVSTGDVPLRRRS
jgi:DNA transposition AAA+ family ATPase